ncbi:ATP-binding protein [Candidatus Endomicrobiellum devescovinae]|jgi:PAS domain S-box-containing protein|uniref:ATP-binding protein n=1 Tax=Candidatus Endomicrobiellum devescovinae TaxID=3242322 RepID=UPI00282798BB|nr:PAS domain S-box protein [Endomicrobium sp.]
MDFLGKNYNYILFISAWSYIFLALACFIGQRTKLNKISYHWFILFAVCEAFVKFIETFSYGDVISSTLLSAIYWFLVYVCDIFLFLGAEVAYLKISKRSSVIKYSIFPLITIPLIGYCFYGIVVFKMLLFICFFVTAWLLILLMEYRYYEAASEQKNKILAIIVCSAFFGINVCILKILIFLNVDSTEIFAMIRTIIACSVFAISNLIFKYFKILKEKNVKIYDYIPFYWKHIPLASILVLLFLLGFFFSNYLETDAKKTIIENTDSASTDILVTSSIIFEKIDQISKSLSNSPFLKESLSNPSSDNAPRIAKMLNAYKNSFDVSLVGVLDMDGKIVFYSNYPDMNFSQKNKIYNENAKFFKHLKTLIKNKALIKENSYINDRSFYCAYVINNSIYGKDGIVFVKDSVLGIVKKLNEFDNAFIINERGRILISGEENASVKNLWNPDGVLGKRKSLLLSEVRDKDIISINNKQFYVSKKFLNREKWSVVKLTHLGTINQSKSLGYFITSALVIILLLISYSINQSNKVLALALLHQDILDSAKSIIILSTDLQGRIVVCGGGTRILTGYDIEELIQTDFSEIIFFDKNKKSITFNKAVSSERKSGLEWLCRRKDGTYIDVLMYIIPQFSVSGKVIGYIFSGLDITEAKKAEKALEEQFQFLQSLLDNIPVAVYYKDAQMRLTGCNKAFEEIVSHSKSEIIGNSTEYLFSDQKAILFSMKTDLQISKDMKPISYELPVSLSDKGIKNLIFYKAAFKNIDGNFGGIIGVLLDVTEERKMQIERDSLQASLIQKNKLAALGELAGSISHELNNPLSIIIGFAQVLSRNKKLDSETEKGLKNIYDAALRSQKIIKNMLEFARMNSADIRDIDLNNVVESTLLIIEKGFAKAGIEIIKDLIKFSIFIKSNAMQMQQVILNILLNAKDAMPNGGKITIKTEEESGNYILSVSDTGSGIAPEILSKIFDPFFTTKETGKGTGLGLSICYGIVKNLKGEISVKSVIGKGTTFYIKFPILK